jgi:hypothetical protein
MTNKLLTCFGVFIILNMAAGATLVAFSTISLLIYITAGIDPGGVALSGWLVSSGYLLAYFAVWASAVITALVVVMFSALSCLIKTIMKKETIDDKSYHN